MYFRARARARIRLNHMHSSMFSLFPSRTVALEVLGFSIHWYGLLYLLSFLLAAYLLPRLQKYRNVKLTNDQWSSVLACAVLGVILGGRLGYVLFYAPSLIFDDPLEILAIWHGGMSSHGGFIGVSLALLVLFRRYKVPLLSVADIIVVPAAVGLALGRLGNFINMELYGTVTTLPWSIEVAGVDGLRHPLQIYAVIQNLCIALICSVLLTKKKLPVGCVLSVFLLLYSLCRFLFEFIREQSYSLWDLGFVTLTRGQILTIPVFLLGMLIFVSARRASSRG